MHIHRDDLRSFPLSRRRASAHRPRWRPLAALLLLATMGCGASFQAAPHRPAADDPAFAAVTPTPKPGMPEDAQPTPDVLCAGDVVNIRFLGDKELEPQTLAVDRTGLVHLPLMGSVTIAGLTVDQGEASLQKALVKFDRTSRVYLSVVETRGRTATVTGAVEHAGVIPLIGEGRLADVLAAAGGPRSGAQEDRLVALGDVDGTRVVRNGKILPVDARRALEGDALHNVHLRPGDVVHVPPALAARVVVLGHVQKPRTMTYRSGMRLTEALADAGGLAKSADNEDVRVIRGGYAAPRVYVTDMKALFAGARPDVVLAPGDIVYVSEHWFSTVTDVLDKIAPVAASAVVAGSLATR